MYLIHKHIAVTLKGTYLKCRFYAHLRCEIIELTDNETEASENVWDKEEVYNSLMLTFRWGSMKVEGMSVRLAKVNKLIIFGALSIRSFQQPEWTTNWSISFLKEGYGYLDTTFLLSR